MFEEPGQVWPVNIPHVALLYQRHKQPERKNFRAVQQKLGDDKVHALHVADFSLVDGEGGEDSSELSMAVTSCLLHEVGVAWKCSPQISFNLR